MDSRDPDSSEALLLDTLTQDTNSEDLGGHETKTPDLPPAIAWRLFISHFLSTWNSRAFEFGAVLYLASIFSKTLQPMSVYALARGASAVVFSPAVGRHIDTSDRLQVARLSIVLQRLVVTVSCVGFWFLAAGWPLGHGVSIGLLAFLTVLACVEKLCSIMNLVSIEKDWVAVIAGNNELTLRVLNSQMRRIDLICKLAGPLFIALINGISTEVAILVNFGMNVVSVVVEYYAIEKYLKDGMRTNLKDLSRYLHHRAFLPSFTCALLYFTVLSFGSHMITYLLFVGYSSIHIGIARTLSVAFEISATWISPLAMARIGPIRSGIWFISWQMLCLAGAVIVFWVVETPFVSVFGLIVGTILSRVGLWGFDLCVQIIVQEEVEPDYRGSFSSLEASWQNIFELCSYVTTIIFSRPDQFQWPVLMSCTAVFTAGGLYTVFVRSRRGHLVHLSRCLDPKEWKRRSPALGYERPSGSSVA